jgi:hypothetical protein
MQTICTDKITEALKCLSLLRILETSQVNLRLPALQLPDAEFQSFAALTRRIQAWLEEMRLPAPIVEQVSHTPDFAGLKIEPADKDSQPEIEVPS